MTQFARQNRLQTYWGKALQLLPDLHFELIDLFVSPGSIVVFYKNDRGAKVCEYLRLDAQGKIMVLKPIIAQRRASP